MGKKTVRKVDRELEEWVEKSKPIIKVIGAGGAGCNTISRMMEVGIKDVETVAVNTDAQDLLFTKADTKLLIGKNVTHGLGAGADPNLGREAALESKDEVKKLLQGSDMVFLTCGLGGGTGTGSLPIIAEIAKKLGILTIGVVTLPFSMEGKQRMKNAKEGVKALSEHVNTLIVIPNDKLLEIAPDLTLTTAFKLCDEILVNAVKGIVELVTKPGLVNRDFADVKAVMKEGGLAMIGLGESNTENRALESIQKALSNPLITVDISGANGALVHVMSGPEITVSEVQKIVEFVSSKLSKDAKILWGASLEKNLGKTIRSMVIVTGVKSPQILGQEKALSEAERKQMEKLLKVKFVE